MEKFEAFKKRIDQDPFNALFGKSNKWLGWTADAIPNEVAKSEQQANALKKKADEYFKNDKARKAMKETIEPVTMEGVKNGAGQHESGGPPVKQECEEQEYEFDPITLRKVPKNMKPESTSKDAGLKNTQKAVEIPVKTFKPTPRSTAMPAKGSSSTQVDDWLAREGFGSPKDARKPMSSAEYDTPLTTKMPAQKIESALNRHVQEKGTDAKKSNSIPTYESKENKNEDIDSLRASDIRASVGRGSQQARKSDPTLDVRSQALEDRDEQLQRFLKEKMKRDESDFKHLEILKKKAVDGSSVGAVSVSKAIEEIKDHYLNELSSVSAQTGKLSSPSAGSPSETAKAEKLSSFSNDKTLQIQSKIVPLKAQLDSMKVEYDALRQAWLAETRRLKAKKTIKLHEEEVAAQKAAMEAAEVYRGEGDMAPNVHQFAVKKTKDQSEAIGASGAERGGEGDMSPNVAQYAYRDRWYKRKAPHARCEMDAKLQQLSKDKALVREVRGIYEDTYGVIDTKHRQEELRGEGDMSPDVAQFASRDRWYKRKAPFNTDGVVVPNEETGIDQGYTMLKEDPSAELLTKDATAASSSTSTPKLEQEPKPRQDQSSIPTATARQIADFKAQLDKQAAQLQTHREEIQFLRSNEATTKPDYNKEHKAENVRRMEPVFSGRKNKEKKRASRRRKTFRHVLLTGVITAACCYATGVAIELMKVNGL